MSAPRVYCGPLRLCHGGSAIRDRARTRASLVSHFYSRTDCVARGCELVPQNGAFWMRRPHQAVPEAAEAPLPQPVERAAPVREPARAIDPDDLSPELIARYLYRRALPAPVRQLIRSRLPESFSSAVLRRLRSHRDEHSA